MGHEYNHFMNLRIGGTPPYPPPPDDRSELDYLNEFIPDTYWFCYAFITPAEIDAFRNMHRVYKSFSIFHVKHFLLNVDK